MIDPVQLPILMKAIDFVFEEGRKILEERREHRKADRATAQLPSSEPEKELVPLEPEKVDEIKQDLISSKVDELLWQNNQREIESLVTQMKKHTENYYTLKEQEAEWGSALVPPVIVSQIRAKENSIIETRQRLEAALSKVYKREIKLDK
jgi:hypothetical protein